MTGRISIIIPTLNEAATLEPILKSLQPLRGKGHEVIVVDGGSSDETVRLAGYYADKVITSERGRALQMNHGAQAAEGGILWFLHADSQIPADAAETIVGAVGDSGSFQWGRFNVRLSGAHWLFRVIEALMNLRSRLTGIATGDQGIFVRRELFQAVDGFAEIPLMEDIDLSKRLKRLAPPCCSTQRLITSSRRWEDRGILRTVLLMWYLRLAYFLGRSPERLAGIYGNTPR